MARSNLFRDIISYGKKKKEQGMSAGPWQMTGARGTKNIKTPKKVGRAI